MAEGDEVVARFSTWGTHQGESEAIGPPTGKRIEITGITIKRFSDGKIVESWTNFDALGMIAAARADPQSRASLRCRGQASVSSSYSLLTRSVSEHRGRRVLFN